MRRTSGGASGSATNVVDGSAPRTNWQRFIRVRRVNRITILVRGLRLRPPLRQRERRKGRFCGRDRARPPGRVPLSGHGKVRRYGPTLRCRHRSPRRGSKGPLPAPAAAGPETGRCTGATKSPERVEAQARAPSGLLRARAEVGLPAGKDGATRQWIRHPSQSLANYRLRYGIPRTSSQSR